jgi:hypothetical protein
MRKAVRTPPRKQRSYLIKAYADPAAAVSGQLLRRLQRDPRLGAQKLYRTLARRAEEQKKERMRLEGCISSGFCGSRASRMWQGSTR